MPEQPGRSHPTDEELQRAADGDIDAAVDASLLGHIEGCAECRAEIERVQRVTAALSLTSVVPELDFARIREQREPRSMRPPVRASGISGNRRLRILVPAGLAAAAALVLFSQRSRRSELEPGANAHAEQPATRLLATMAEWRQPAIDSAIAGLEEPQTRIEISFSAPGAKSVSAGRQLADSVARYLRERGVRPDRVTVTRATAARSLPPGSITITIVGGPSP